MKKIYEFSTLCGVDVCTIIYPPNFDNDQGEFPEPETWPQDKTEVQRIIEKYNNTTSDRRPKIYDVEEYYKDRVKRVEAEISKVRKDKLKIMYPTWNESFNSLGEEQLRIFLSVLDAKIDSCEKRIKNLKQDPKGKAIEEESRKVETLNPYLASNPSSYLNFMQNISQEQNFHPSMKTIGDNNQLEFYPFQFNHGSQSSMFQFDQNLMQIVGNNGMVNWVGQVGADSVAYDPKSHLLTENRVENNQNTQSYDNGNFQTMQPYMVSSLKTESSQNSRHEASLHNISPLPPGFQFNELYDPNVLEAQMFNYMHGRK